MFNISSSRLSLKKSIPDPHEGEYDNAPQGCRNERDDNAPSRMHSCRRQEYHASLRSLRTQAISSRSRLVIYYQYFSVDRWKSLRNLMSRGTDLNPPGAEAAALVIGRET